MPPPLLCVRATSRVCGQCAVVCEKRAWFVPASVRVCVRRCVSFFFKFLVTSSQQKKVRLEKKYADTILKYLEQRVEHLLHPANANQTQHFCTHVLPTFRPRFLTPSPLTARVMVFFRKLSNNGTLIGDSVAVLSNFLFGPVSKILFAHVF